MILSGGCTVRYVHVTMYLTVIRWTGVLGSDIASGINLYSNIRKLGLKAKWCVSDEKMLPRIKEMLSNDIPMIFSIGPKKNKGVYFYKLEPKAGDPYNFTANTGLIQSHYAAVTGMMIDSVKNQTMLEISSWGIKYYIDYDEYIEFVDTYQ